MKKLQSFINVYSQYTNNHVQYKYTSVRTYQSKKRHKKKFPLYTPLLYNNTTFSNSSLIGDGNWVETYSEASLPNDMLSATLSGPNLTITESVSPYMTYNNIYNRQNDYINNSTKILANKIFNFL